MRVGNADVLCIETVAQDFGAEPAIGLELAQAVEKPAQGGVSRGAGAIDGGLGGGVGVVLGFGNGAAAEAPGGAHDLDGQQLLDGADGVEVFPKGFGDLGIFGGFVGPDAVLGGEEAELEVIAGGAGLTFGARGAARQCGVEAIGFELRGRRHGWGISFSAPE